MEKIIEDLKKYSKDLLFMTVNFDASELIPFENLLELPSHLKPEYLLQNSHQDHSTINRLLTEELAVLTFNMYIPELISDKSILSALSLASFINTILPEISVIETVQSLQSAMLIFRFLETGLGKQLNLISFVFSFTETGFPIVNASCNKQSADGWKCHLAQEERHRQPDCR